MIRKEIRSLPPVELLALRRAMILFQKKTDTDGYISIAGIHGDPGWHCNHDTGFLPWHRMYIWLFENALRKIDNSITLPYWDWASERDAQDFIAPAHNDRDFDTNGVSTPNPLYSGPVPNQTNGTARCVTITNDELNALAGDVSKFIATRKSFREINAHLVNPHTSIHLLINGDMSNQKYAAYDPIFWSHHATVDRQWAIWQKLHPGPDASIPMDLELEGLDKKVQDVLDYENQLGYQYDNLDEDVDKFRKLTRSRIPVTIMKMRGITMGMESYAVDVFLKNNQTNEEAYAGFFGIFGMGKMMGMGNHMQHRKSDQYIDIGAALKKLNADKNNVTIELHAVDMKGNVVNTNRLPIEGLDIL
jgi:hypothetical protein